MYNLMSINAETIAIARSTNAVDYLRRKGVELKPEGRVHFPAEHDSLKIKDNYFHWFSRGLHGNTIDLAMAYFGYDFRTAVSDILSVGATTVPATTTPGKTKNTPAELPVKTENEHRVIAYLCQRRKIAYKIVKQLIQDGRLYQDKHGNCVFTIQERRGNKLVTTGAEITGTGAERFKRDMTSRSDEAFTLKLGQWTQHCKPTHIYFESVVDLLSYCQLRNMFETNAPVLLVSLRGLKDQPAKRIFSESVNYEKTIHLIATDNDIGGDEFYNHITQWWATDPYSKGSAFLCCHTIERLRPDEGFKDWNDILTTKCEVNMKKVTVQK